MSYPPRWVFARLRAGVIESVFTSGGLLACVARYACMARCPRDIPRTEVLLPLVRGQVFLTRMVPDVVEELIIVPDGTSLEREEMRMIPSETGDHAREEALLVKQRYGGRVTLVTPDTPGAPRARRARGRNTRSGAGGSPFTHPGCERPGRSPQ